MQLFILLAAVGQLIFLNGVRISITSAWRGWALWCTSRPCTSCISPGKTPASQQEKHLCVAFGFFQPDTLWWIIKPRIYLHMFLQGHIELDNWLFKAIHSWFHKEDKNGTSWNIQTIDVNIIITFRTIYTAAFLWCFMLNKYAHTESRTESFIQSPQLYSSDTVNHDRYKCWFIESDPS